MSVDNFRDVYENQAQLKAGLDSAEFNLRAHQKVLNALVQEIESLVDESTDGKKLLHVEGALVEGKLHVDWAKYHQYVENDLVEVRKIEAAKQKAEYGAVVKNIKDNLEAFVAQKKQQIEGLDEDQKEKAHASLVNFTKSIESEVNLYETDGEYDTKKLNKFRSLIITSLVGSAAKPAKAEETPVVEPPKSEYPEGATVFGG